MSQGPWLKSHIGDPLTLPLTLPVAVASDESTPWLSPKAPTHTQMRRHADRQWPGALPGLSESLDLVQQVLQRRQLCTSSGSQSGASND